MKLKRDTLFFRFLDVYGQLIGWENKTDICFVIRHLLIGIVITLFIVIFAVLAAIIVIDAPLSIGLSLYYDLPLTVFFILPTFMIGIIGYFALLMIGIFKGVEYLFKKTISSISVQENKQVISFKNITKVYYKAWKNKYCLKIDIES
jgi:hypothetical protein